MLCIFTVLLLLLLVVVVLVVVVNLTLIPFAIGVLPTKRKFILTTLELLSLQRKLM
jgi:hypothetical protein